MATKLKSHPLNGAHTAGIFSDMSIDGPEIGTLVLIIDRAKNLPNRKTIGKQDPYCAARLGKEAKKTKTDIRGGQTPRWDQELRFTVHDSPDYYQLKISVFNDDKKTDLIGECWIDLRDIIVGGGGQSDSWHTLNCRSKYAGDVRIEITYYDSRPKPEKPVAKPKPVEQPEAHNSLPRAAAPKRRPLPSDPVTGQTPQPSIPEHAQTPPRPQPNPPASYIPNQSPLQTVEYNTPPSRRYTQPQPQPDQYSPAPPAGGYASASGPADMQYSHRGSMDRPDRYSGHPGDESEYGSDYRRQSHNRYDSRSSFDDSRSSFSMPPANDPRQFPADDDRPPPPPVHRTRNNSGAAQEAMLRSGYDLSPQKGTPPSMRHDVLRNEAHRQSVSSGSAYPGRPAYRPYDSAPAPLPSGPDYQSPEQHQPSPPRHHSYDSNYDPHFRSMQPTVEDVPESPSPVVPHSFRKSGSRPPSNYEYDEFDQANGASPAPLNLGGRGSSASGHYSQSPAPIQNSPRRPEPNGYTPSVSPISSRERDYAPPMSTSPGMYDPRHSYGQQYSGHRDDFVDQPVNSAGQYGLPAVPSSLVPGIDPSLSMEISERINEDRRHQRRNTQPTMETPPRGRRMIEAGPGYAPESSPQPYQTPQHTPQHQQSFDRSPVLYSGGQSPNIVKPRAISPNPYHSGSPNPHHTIKRKSISPAPPPAEGRRLSGIPFGPDDYDALNPSVVSANSNESARSDVNDAGKIITYDGKEIDPSDHLPMDTWAPEPEPKKPSAPVTPTTRPSPAGAQPMPSSTGRRQLRIAGRPQSMASSPVTYGSEPEPSPTHQPSPLPVSTGRNRLQKKSNRQSAMPVMSGANGGSPLAPLSHGHDNYTPPRQMVRASTFDYPNENSAPAIGSYGRPRSRGDERGGYHSASAPPMASGPPVPAKIPLMSGSMPLPPAGGGYGGGMGMGGGELTLAEEMSRIDIGTGRARRHQRY